MAYTLIMPTVHTHPACLAFDDLSATLDTRRGRASGPGGQHRNKVETAVQLTHRPTGIGGWASERRSQSENHRVALRRLRMNLAIEHRLALPQPFVASDLWMSRVKGTKLVISHSHADYPAMLAEAMDVLEHFQGQPGKAVAVLHCSQSQLIKLLKAEPKALQKVNDLRKSLGQHPLR